MKGYVIAIDGPAGVGKSSVGRTVASKLGCRFINTGEMYRALAWKAINIGISMTDEKAVCGLAKEVRWEFKCVKRPEMRTFLDGVMMGRQIRSEAVSKGSSLVARIPSVRKFMKDLQRRLGADGAIVMEGRDIGTNVFPDADLKIYLDASAQERARRRFCQLKKQKFKSDYKAILDSIIKRDLQDSGRKANPLKKAGDSVVIDTTQLSLKEVSGKILEICGKGPRLK